MKWRDRLPDPLHKPIIVCECSINLCVRSRRQYDIGMFSCSVLEEFLNDQEIQLAQGLFTSVEMFRQKSTSHVQSFDIASSRIKDLTWGDRRIHHLHVVRADAVIEKRKRMQQDSCAFFFEDGTELRYYCLSAFA